MLQPKLLAKVISLLDENNIDYMITGSLVSSIQGEPRTTHDIDLLINVTPDIIVKMEAAFPPPQYYFSAEAIKEAIRDKSIFNLIDTSEGDKVDFWILTTDHFDRSRFKRKYEENLFGMRLKVSTPEDTILAKLRWAKLSGGSEKQFNDALRVYEVQFHKLDLTYLKEWAHQLGVFELWSELKLKANPV